jgi:hypothetical protein
MVVVDETNHYGAYGSRSYGGDAGSYRGASFR